MTPRLAPLRPEPEPISALIAAIVKFESAPVDEFEAPTKVERPCAAEGME